jgi:hypothetical protein
MNTEAEQVLSLLVDGEAVDPDELATALAEPDAATTLVEFARVHRAVRGDDERPSERFYEAMHGHLAALHRTAPRWRLPLAAAALVLLSTLGGVWLGSSWFDGAAPMPVAVATGVGATNAALPIVSPDSAALWSASAAPQPGCGGERAPAPDRTLRFTPGVDWQAGARTQRGHRP